MEKNRALLQGKEGAIPFLSIPWSGIEGAGEGVLKLQERLSHLIAQTTTDAFVAIDPENRIIYWNKGAEELFGWRAEDILGQSLNLIVPQVHHVRHLEGVRRLSEGHAPRLTGKMTSVTAIHRNGREVQTELALTHWINPETGRPAGYAAIMRDVSARLELEAERDAYQRKLEEQLAAIEATSDGVAITDAEGFFTYLNQAHCTMFGYAEPSGLLGRHWSIIYSPHEARRIEQVAMPEVFTTGTWRGEARGLHRDGSIVEQEVALAKSPSGGLVCTTRDMAERQQAIRERIRARESLLLAERQELVSRAVSGVAHDFANLMAVISASAVSLGRAGNSRPPELDRIEGAANQATAMLELILAPLRNARADRALDARSALATVVDLTAVTLKSHHSIHLHAPDEGIALKAAGTEFLRVLMNLCSNARDALPSERQGFINITLERLHPSRRLAKRVVGAIPEEPCALITVSDNGCGIADEDLVRIFQPFETTKSFGTGLGLAVVSAVVTEAGGAICVRSGRHGTMFQLVWPLAEAGLNDQQAVLDDLCPAMPRARVLVVDDNPQVLDLVASELHKAEVVVTALASPVEALAVLREIPTEWDAVIVDYDMPEMNGAELATRIRGIAPHLPIILCTALHEAEIDIAGSPFEDRVVKSAITTDLNLALRRVLAVSKERGS
ncbi:MAG: PAS domain S-box protein [Porphyrobacter sp.]|nr:PAS domain S-box protein [Porphyrobacter sp.]